MAAYRVYIRTKVTNCAVIAKCRLSQKQADKKVLTKIRNDYSKPLTLDDLAEEAQLNKQYFCRAFRQATGKTPIDYLNYYRIECAAEQLSLSYVSITEIALSCGFNDLSYFNRLFKRSKGVTPSNYRKDSDKSIMPPLEREGDRILRWRDLLKQKAEVN